MSRHTHAELPPHVAHEVALLAPRTDSLRRMWRDDPPHVIARLYAVEELTIRTLLSCNACRDQVPASSPQGALR